MFPNYAFFFYLMQQQCLPIVYFLCLGSHEQLDHCLPVKKKKEDGFLKLYFISIELITNMYKNIKHQNNDSEQKK